MQALNNFQSISTQLPIGMVNVDLSQSTAEYEALLVGYLALNSLVADSRWITVVVDKVFDLHKYKPLLMQSGRVRIIQADTEELLWITWQCLAQGNSQAVITLMNSIDCEDRRQLQAAAAMGDSRLQLIQIT